MLPGALEMMDKNSYDIVICDSMFGSPVFLNNILAKPVVSSHSGFALSRAPVPDSMLIKGCHPQLETA